ncbi:MAG: AAA family ATPase [Proteobacteria bacterium]|nr:AAA family ATPase [Pseudomonadota bacterium]
MMSAHELIVESFSTIVKNSTISFISGSSGEGTTTAVVATAKALSNVYSAKVLVVDANFNHQSLNRLFNVSESPGLKDIMADPGISLDRIIHRTNDGFDIVCGGWPKSLGFKSVNFNNFNVILEHFKAQYDFVLIDMCPINHFPILDTVISLVDGVIMVLACESTRWEVAQNIKERLVSADVKIRGVILSKRRFYIPQWLYQYI